MILVHQYNMPGDLHHHKKFTFLLQLELLQEALGTCIRQ